MIKIIDLSKSFDDNRVLEGVNAEIKDSETFVIVGKSGIGKSVLLRCITGLMKADSGSISIDGEEVNAMGREDLLRIRKKIGMLLQEGALFDSMTVYENIAFPLQYHRLFSHAAIDKKVRYFLDVVEMNESIDAMPAELSGGMKRKVALARAMILEPRYLLYDEPTSGLDPTSAGIVESLIVKLKREMNITSLIVTHDLDLARYVGDRIALLDEGRLITIESRKTAFTKNSQIYEHFIHNRERVHTYHGN